MLALVPRSLCCAACSAVCLPSELTSARLCPPCAAHESSTSRARFDARLETIIKLVDAGAYSTAIPLVEQCITEAYSHFRLDIAARLEETLPTLRARRPAVDA